VYVYLRSKNTSDRIVTMSKIGVIVDAFSSGSLLAPEFIKRGYTMIHIRTSRVPYYGFMHTPFRKQDFALDIFEKNIKKLISKLKKYNVSFVIAGTEPAVELADTLAEELQVVGNGTKYSHARRTKYEMIETIRKAGLRTAKQIRTSSFKKAIAFANSLPVFDIILKPERGSGGNLVFHATNELEVKNAFRQILSHKTDYGEKNSDVCVQEFLVGEKYAVNTVSCNGKCVVTDIIKYKLSDANGVPFYDYDEILSPRDGPVLTEMEEYTKKAVLALGIKWGPAHPEIMLTKDGPVVIEIGARLAGAGLPRLEKEALGQGQVEFTVAAYIDRNEFNKLSKKSVKIINHCFLVYLNSHKEGILKSVNKFSKIEKLLSFSRMLIEVSAGDRIRKTIDMDTIIGLVYLVHKRRSQVIKDYGYIRKLEQEGLYDVE